MDWLIEIFELVLFYGMIVFLSIDNSGEKNQESLRCDPCSCNNRHEQATTYCLDCTDPEAFCKNCARKHLTLRTSRRHVLSADLTSLRLKYLIEGVKPKTYELSCAFCVDLNIKATSFCMNCDHPKPMCTLCASEHIFGRNIEKHFILSDINIFQSWVKGEIPGKPYIESEQVDSISLKWIDKTSLSSNECYQLRYQKHPDGKWLDSRFLMKNVYQKLSLLPDSQGEPRTDFK